MFNLPNIKKGQSLLTVMPMHRNTGKTFMMNTQFLRNFMNSPQYYVRKKMEFSRSSYGFPQFDSLSEAQSVGRVLRYAFN